MNALFVIGVMIIVVLATTRPRRSPPITITLPDTYEQPVFGCSGPLMVGFVILLVLSLLAS